MFKHETVLKEEAIFGLNLHPAGTYVDCTLGGAGHSEEIAKRLDASGVLIGLDQDPYAIEHAKKRLSPYPCTVHCVKRNFIHLLEVMGQLGIDKVDGILFDLGVSSVQLDEAERGFSYHAEAPLDMRMDPQQEMSALDVVNDWEEEEIARILTTYGEEKFAYRIAKEIGRARQKERITTTLQLVDLIKKAIPAAARRTGPHPARRSFQAIRIAVNDELTAFRSALDQSLQLLKEGGRIGVITFHSLEDRICKHFFQEKSKTCICSPSFPVCVCEHKPSLRLVTRKPVIPTEDEIERNNRARSAKLRVAEKI